jgi:hypothetical protein
VVSYKKTNVAYYGRVKAQPLKKMSRLNFSQFGMTVKAAAAG